MDFCFVHWTALHAACYGVQLTAGVALVKLEVEAKLGVHGWWEDSHGNGDEKIIRFCQ